MSKLHISQKILYTLLSSSFLALSGCNGENEPNLPPEVSIGSTVETRVVSESFSVSRSFTVEAEVNDPDGVIDDITWELLSGQNILLENADTDMVSFTYELENSEEQNQLILEVNATDNRGASAFAIYEIDLNDAASVFVPNIVARRGEQTELSAIIRGRESKVSQLVWDIPALNSTGFSVISNQTISFFTPTDPNLETFNVLLMVTFMDGTELQSVGTVTLE